MSLEWSHQCQSPNSSRPTFFYVCVCVCVSTHLSVCR
uniref:Uncharacterized protein n=1 Tax=Anguilla anguilla TaxID=7936 RepID=A0A0E9VQM3_ANGAN